MTWWAAPAVAGFAHGAGFRGDDLTTAVAVALAGSGGEDSASWSTLTPPKRETRGLWLIPLGAVLGDPDGRLWDPTANVAVAYSLTVTAGGGWQWSSVWRAGTWRRFVPAAAAAAAHPEPAQPSAVSLTPPTMRDGGRRLRMMLDSQQGKVPNHG